MPVAVCDSCSRYAYYVLARGTSPCDVSNRAAHCGSTRARPAALVTRQLLVHSSLHTPSESVWHAKLTGRLSTGMLAGTAACVRYIVRCQWQIMRCAPWSCGALGSGPAASSCDVVQRHAQHRDPWVNVTEAAIANPWSKKAFASGRILGPGSGSGRILPRSGRGLLVATLKIGAPAFPGIHDIMNKIGKVLGKS